MTLKKTIASYKDESGNWVPQRDIDMHPLEEAEMLAHWAIHNEQIKVIPKPSTEQELDWMIEHGADFVKQKRAEYRKSLEEAQPQIEAAQLRFQECHKKWCSHVEVCHHHKVDHDTFIGDATKSLSPIPEEK